MENKASKSSLYNLGTLRNIDIESDGEGYEEMVEREVVERERVGSRERERECRERVERE